MTIPRIGNVKELDSKVMEDQHIVAVFGICHNTLCIQDHALERYISRGDQSNRPVLDSILNQLYYLLSASQVVRRRNEAKQKAKHAYQEAVYRFEDGWIFVLTWVEQFGYWLLKTVYRKEETQMRVYGVQYTRAAIRASAWAPPLAV